jgi:protein-L-isoaspartate O-methyltransferase
MPCRGNQGQQTVNGRPYRPEGGGSERILNVRGKVPHQKCVPAGTRMNAYANHPLSISHGKTIAQP